MKHRLFTLFVLLALMFAFLPAQPARADSTITVITTADTIAIDGACTLREAINNANSDSDTTSGDCTAGSGNDTILFDSSLGTNTITLASTLPDIIDTDGLTIDGDNRITLSGNDSVRVLYVSETLTLQNISVTHGNAGNGSGLFNNGGTVTITHSAFSNNNATNVGGGVANNVGTLTILNSAFSNNSAASEGGGVSNGGTLTITNSTFSNNSATTGYGGGVMNNSGTATILNSTFSGNSSAAGGGGGVSTWNGSVAPTTTIRNTILANSVSSSDCYNYGSSTLNGGNNIIETTSTCNSIATLTSDPTLGSLTGSPAYFPFTGASPAIDAGDDAICAAAPVSNTSQNGVTRPQGLHCDIGAYEKAVIVVNSAADTSVANGLCTLREAMNNANTNSDTTSGDCAAGSGYDYIFFSSSLGTATITLASTLPDITDSAGLTIDGDNRVTLSGNDSVRVLYVSGGASGGGFTLQNISVTHGNISTASGGGLYNTNGKVTITHSVFSNNSSTNNSGGGAVNSGSLATMTISHSTFSNNSAANDGGGVVNGSGAVLTIANSTFLDNSANYGGGVQNINSALTLLNSTFSGNSAASGTGAAVGTWNNAAIPSTTIYNTILANSVTGVDCWNHATGVLIGTNNIIETSGSGSNGCSTIAVSTADPMLGSLTGSPAYFPLTLGSPAIDAGDDAVCAAAPVSNTSQNGVTRPQGAHCDIGSYEKVPPSVITVNSTADTSATDGACTLREAINNANNNAATYGDCLAGSGNDTILFDSSLGTATITLASTLPNITDSAGLTIDGDHRITLSGNDSVQVLNVYVGALLTLQNISVTHGSATQGGGVNNSGTLTITNSTFSNNSATNEGGGVDNFGGTLTIANSTFSNNSATFGGGVENNSGTATLLNSTFSSNSATNGGGGVDTYQGGTTPPTTTIRNTILANSTAGGDCVNYATGTLNGGNNIIESTTTCTSIATLISDPNLGSLTGSPAYFPLNYGSPAIDAGDDAVCAAAPVNNESQNGVTRPQGLHCEIGAFEYIAPTILSLTLRSSGAQDGWILESTETSTKGGSLDSAATTFRLGDDAARKQYRGILSFATGASLPDTAFITKVTLKVKRQGIIGGGNPVTTFLGFMVDIKKGFFGTTVLQASDFQTAASKSYGPFKPTPASNWYSLNLTSGKAYINKLATSGGLTQIRLRFKLDDNNNAITNYLSLYSGNAPAASRPQLIIEYYVLP